MLQRIKRAVLPGGAQRRVIPFGLYRGIALSIDFASQTQLYLGLDEAETRRFLRRVIPRAAWVIDVGAGVGELSLFALRSGVRTVFACDADPRCIRDIAQHRQWNPPTEGLEVVSGWIGRDHALDDFPVDPAGQGFVKIDVEGAELDVLRSGHRLLTTGGPRDLLVETHRADLETDCLAYLRDLGYTTAIIRNAWWRAIVPERRPTTHNRWLAAWRSAAPP